ncbi:unnamed protein product [Rotaria magnacalcarata]|uniref:Uncharacterized protein n=1 Tax=Rotaria magnacalcarata TaxID=392030 RepID=A0A816VCS9_9BILA|nr:unnamed protein product [Rotaria magnacalcarata]CAF5202595.1 unnamed protein product [Rotaria magnacalcarata]
MEDDGLRQLIQECISIGARYGNIDVNRVLRGADVTAEHVSTLANKHRCRITKVLAEPIENDAVTFCPDIWSDPIRQISYLCISVAFVDDQYQYRSYDLCCSPFEEEDKSSESIIAVLQKVLKRFGINDLSLVKFVSDPGSKLCESSEELQFIFLFCTPAKQYRRTWLLSE